MLAKLEQEPFDSDEHLFEIKWDGIRALSFVEEDGYRLLSRNRFDLKPRYPELGFLADLEEGLVLDGEIIALKEGRPDFHAVLKREQARNPMKIEALMRSLPVSYVVFDILYRDYEPVLDLPLIERREELLAVVETAAQPRLVLSEGLIGSGRTFFEGIQQRQLEGMVAKRLDSTYQPGRRTGAWTKVKQAHELACVVLGWTGDDTGPGDLRSLIIATEEQGQLVCVGRVGSGLTDAMRTKLLDLCRARATADPLIEIGTALDDGKAGHWIEPGVFCKVKYLERTENGLRAPVFLELIQVE